MLKMTYLANYFAKFLSRLDGSAQDYSGAVDRQALVMEQTDEAARQALSN